MKNKPTIIISAGGTGGHIFPALAVAALLAENYRILWVGAKVGLENKLVPQHNYRLVTVNVGGVRNKGRLRKLLLPFTLLRASGQCLLILLRHRPAVIVGFGGYATFPIALMGKLLARPVVIHEQNSVAGLTNRILAHLAKTVLTAFPNVLPSKKTYLVGNPVRLAITKVTAPAMREVSNDSPLRILVIGGSLGAKALNDNVPLALARIPHHVAEVVHQVGRGDAAGVRELYQQYQINARVVDFIDNMAEAYAHADLIICRAGASTVAEISAVGIAAIFVPYPYAVDDHQTTNAKYLLEHGGAFLIPQKELTPEGLAELVASLTREGCRQIAIRARTLGIVDSTEKICQQITKLIY